MNERVERSTPPLTASQKAEWGRCAVDVAYFAHAYCQIYDATACAWVPFELWSAQRQALAELDKHLLTVILKARQLGMSWLVLAYALHLMLFKPAATVSLFSRRETEAIYLLGTDRLRGMYARLPDWMRGRQHVETDNDRHWQLSNGSVARAFPTSAGDSYTVSLAIVDEADLAPDLNALMKAAKPTIDGGGRMILLSRADKSQPNSEFKRIYRGAKAGASPWHPIFLPWSARPTRDQAWYDEQRRDVLSRTTALDDLHEQYPATDTEAMAPKSLDKRLPATWLLVCHVAQAAVTPADAPSIPGLTIYRAPQDGHRYVIGMDPAEGNPTSDDSALTVLDRETGEEVAALAGKLQPSTFAAHSDQIGRYFNAADLLVERNNHGHAVLLWLDEHSELMRLDGLDGKPGWATTATSKTLVYDDFADGLRDKELIIHSFETYMQLASIDGSTLSAPEGEMDDRAMSIVLARRAQAIQPATGFAQRYT